MNSAYVQNKVVQRVTEMLSEKLGNHISIGDVRVAWFNTVTVSDLLVTDERGDTILAAPELTGRLNMLAFMSQTVEVHHVSLNKADVRFAIDPETDNINIRFIIDHLKSNDTTLNKPKWIFGIETIELSDCRFSFKNVVKPFDRLFGMNYADLDVTNLNLTVSGFHPGDNPGGVEFQITQLSCTEKCGLEVRFLSAGFAVNSNQLSFKNVQISTALSEMEARDASFHFGSFKDFGGDNFISKVRMNMDIQSSEVAFSDLSYFVPYFANYSDKVMITGKVSGTVENLKGDRMTVQFGDMTQIDCNFDLKGLPRIRSTYIYADFDRLTTCPKDIERIQVSLRGGHVNLPEYVSQLAKIGYKGNFTGFYDDFVTYGKFTTNLGSLSTDLSIQPVINSEIDTSFTFRGALKTDQFQLGRLLQQPVIGGITLSGMVEGSASGKGDIHAQLEGQIGSIDMKGYEYRNITVNGEVNNRMYDGQLSIDEPNIKMDFSGKLDMTHAIPAYDFRANVERAKLHQLNLVESDTSSFAAFNIRGTFSGTNIDNLSGELELQNSLIRRNSREIEINNLELFTKSVRDTNRFILLSDILDAEIRGEYQFLKLRESFFSMVKNFAPAWAPATANPDSLSHNNFRFEATFKETQKLTDFFVDEFRVARGARIQGVYNPSRRDVNFTMNVPYMVFGGKQLRGFYLTANVEDSTFVIESGSTAFRVNKNLSFDNPTVVAHARGDSILLDIKWNNRDSILYRGNLSSKIFFREKPDRPIPLIEIFSSPGQAVFANDQWNLTHQGIFIDSSSVKINNIRASMGNQELLASGVVSHLGQDKLEIGLKDLNLSVVNSSLQFDKLLFGGIANGSASLSNLYHIPVFVSDIHIEDFSLNGSAFGNTDIEASWDSPGSSVHIDVESFLNHLQTVKANGKYLITNQALDFDVSLKQVPAAILQPYLENIFTGMGGTLSSEMKLTGAINDPLMNGWVEIHNAALTLDYTKTRYRFAGVATVTNNTIQFREMELFDQYNHLCRTDGFISIRQFKDITLDMSFQANNLEVLNTAERDNSLFFGKAFATGTIRIRGNPQEMQLDIIARTERNTQFNIPLSSGDDASRANFITFVDHTPRPQRRPLEYLRRRVVDTTDEPVPETKFNININMEVTPDAEAKLIFDATIGDIIRARGSGNLKLNISADRFVMAGTYTIDEGDYLFTLQNLLSNKYFTIAQGGIISWTGDPMGALLNLKATYTARPSLYDLMNDENVKGRSVPVDCILQISNTLTNPDIRLQLEMPNAGQEIKSFLSAATNTEEEISQQFLSLLVMNKFFPDPNRSSGGAQGSGFESMGRATALEFVTNQLSYMLSQWSDDVDVEFSYRPGTYSTGQIYEGGISTNRWSFHANYEIAAENSASAGEFYFDYKLPTKSGKLRFKAFNRSNPNYISQSPYTQGIGLVFREDFNHITDLFRRKKSPAIRREEENEDFL